MTSAKVDSGTVLVEPVAVVPTRRVDVVPGRHRDFCS